MSAVVDRLPPPKKGRKRHSGSMYAAGLLSLQWVAKHGLPEPDMGKVQRLNPLPEVEVPTRSPELLLIALIFSHLPDEAKDDIRALLRCEVFGPNPHPDFVAAYRLLERGRDAD